MTSISKARRRFPKSSDKPIALKQRAKKSLGQNFLVDTNIARKIVDELCILEGEQVVEIGPGKGALTRLIVRKGAKVVGVEKDFQLSESLRAEFCSTPSFELVNGDFLDYQFKTYDKLVKVVGNIPYNLTSKIVSKLVDSRSKLDFAVLMLQEEVADRLAAKWGTKSYGALSVRLQLTAGVKKLFQVPPTCFQPRPKVTSQVIKISFQNRDALADEERFVTFIKKAFGMRRKMLRHFISHYYGKLSLEKLPQNFHVMRIEAFPPEEIYHIFSVLESND